MEAWETRDVAQWLKAHYPLVEDLSSVPDTHIEWLATAYN